MKRRERENSSERLFLALVMAAVLIMTAGAVGPAGAALTGPLGADQHEGVSLAGPGGVLDLLYGWDNLLRIDDYEAAVTDEYWTVTDAGAMATAVAKYAGFRHHFGVFREETGSDFHKLLNSGKAAFGIFGDPGMAAGPGSADLDFLDLDSTFRFGLKLRGTGGYRWSSAVADNLAMPGGKDGDGGDHMVTYAVIGNDAEHRGNSVGNYIVAWEDLSADGALGSYDGDFADLVVELSGVEPAGNGLALPEPAPLILLALASLPIIRRQRRTR